MDDRKATRTNVKILFRKKLARDEIAKSLGDLGKAIVKVSGKTLGRAGKRAFDFRQPSLPGVAPGPGQDLPALPPPRKGMGWAEPPALSGTEKVLEKSTDWRKRPLWMWISGGGWKGLLGARRYWASLARHVLDGFGRVAWTFRVAAVMPLQFVLSRIILLQKTVKNLDFSPEKYQSAIHDYRLSRTPAERNLNLSRVHYHWCAAPGKKIYWKIWRAYCLIPLIAGAAVFLEALALAPAGGWERVLMAVYSLLALGLGLWPWYVLMRINDRLPEAPSDLQKIPGSSILAGFVIPSFVHSAPGSIPACVFSTFFGSAGGSTGSCSGSPIGSFLVGSQVLANIAPALVAVAGMVSVLAMFLLTVTYGYYLTQAMHTAAHTGDWTHQGVNAAWAPIRGAVSAAMIAAPGGLSILASFVLFVASTGNGIGDTAASKVSATLVAPSIATTIPPGLQAEVDNALYSLVCAHVLDNFVNPQGTIQAVTAQPDAFGNLGFSNVTGTGSYGPAVCGDYSMPPGSSTTMAANQSFGALIRAGGPLDQVATAIASGTNGCGSLVIGTGLSPCAPAGTPSNRQVFGQGGGLTNPAGGQVGTLTHATQQYITALVTQGQAPAGTPVSEVQTQGWVALGAFYEFMSNTSSNWNQIVQSLPQNIAPGGFADWSSIAGSEAQQEIENAFGLTKIYIDHYGFSGPQADPSLPFWAASPLSPSGTGRNMAASLSAVVDPTTQQTLSLPNYMAGNLNADPLSKLQNVIESADTAAAVGELAVGNPYGRAAIVAGAAAVGGPTGAALAYTASKKAKELLDPVTVVLGILTIVVGSYLPLVAMFAAGFYVLFWILEVTILVLFAPLWALAVGIPQGEGFIGQHGKEGLARVTDIALRPVLFAGMFVVSLGLYYLSSDMLIVLTSEALGANKNVPSAGMFFSLAGVLGSYLVYALVLWRTIHFAFEILHTGPYWAMKVLGIESRDGRESRAMEAGGQNVLHSMQTVFSGFGRPIPPSGGGKGGQA
ncbi:MAG: DotA/TraY family protein [Leptospirillum sp.]|jgi:conjugal transfer/type IV secretion protein DotA/TraY